MKKLTLVQALPYLRSGDLAFFRVTKRWRFCAWIQEKITAWWQNSPYIHVGIIEMKGGVPWLIDMSASAGGGREEPLQSDLADYDVDIYRLNRDYNRRICFCEEKNVVTSDVYRFDAAFTLMKVRELCKRKYSWRTNLRIMLERCFGYDKLSNDEAIVRAVNCATVIESAFNDCGFDLCPRMSPGFATPDRLARSALLDCLFTVEL